MRARASRSRAARRARGRASRRGRCVRRASSASCRSSSSAPSASSAVYGSSSTSSSRLVQERAAEREPLRHAARVRRDALVRARPRGRSARAASRSARAARARGRAGRRGRGSRARSARGRRAARGRGSRARRGRRRPRARRRVGAARPRDEPEQRRLARAVRAGDEQEAAALEVEVEPPQHALLARSASRAPRARITASTSARTNSEEHDADHAVDREERGVEPAQVAGSDERVLVGEQRRDDGDAEPVETPDVEPEARRRRAARRSPTWQSRAPREDAAHAEARRPRVQPLARGRCSRSKSA